MATDHFPVNGQDITETRMRELCAAIFGISDEGSNTLWNEGVVIDGMEVTYSGADISISAGTFVAESGLVVELTTTQTYTHSAGSETNTRLWIDSGGTFSIDGSGTTAHRVVVCSFDADAGSNITALYPMAIFSTGSFVSNQTGMAGLSARDTDRTSTLADYFRQYLVSKGPTRITWASRAQPDTAPDDITMEWDYDYAGNAPKSDGWYTAFVRTSDGDGTNEAYTHEYSATDYTGIGPFDIAPAGTNGVDTVAIIDGIYFSAPNDAGSPLLDVDITISSAGTVYAGVFMARETGSGVSG